MQHHTDTHSLYSLFGFKQLAENMRQCELNTWADALKQQVTFGLDPKRHGDLPKWLIHFNSLMQPDYLLSNPQLELTNEVKLFTNDSLSNEVTKHIQTCLEGLIPWRKGPFNIHGIALDTEWRSDMKWQRIAPHIEPLHNRLVLDVGCGNGYHMWRMLGAGARRVIGTDPSARFVVQFQMLKQLASQNSTAKQLPIDIVPCTAEQIPAGCNRFDTVFSMGVFYHRRSPIDHLLELQNCLRADGQLVLETLCIKGTANDCLLPQSRYAQMRNVWFIPSPHMLITMLQRIGFKNIKIIDENQTSCDEQRSTDWMRFQSLRDFLDADDINKTVEGYPAPRRVSIVANKA